MTKKVFSVSAYLENESSILLVKHVKQQAWVPVGGRLELNESPLDALIREVREETGRIFGKDCAEIPTNSHDLGFGKMPGLVCYEEHPVLPDGVHMCFSYFVHTRHRALAYCDEFTDRFWLNYPQFSALRIDDEGHKYLYGVAIPPNVVQILSKCFGLLHGAMSFQ